MVDHSWTKWNQVKNEFLTMHKFVKYHRKFVFE
jgi:hypothetical protein